MKNKQGEKELSLLVYNTIESFPTVTIPLSKQFLKLIMFLFWKKILLPLNIIIICLGP